MGKTPSALSGTSPKSTTKSFDVNNRLVVDLGAPRVCFAKDG